MPGFSPEAVRVLETQEYLPRHVIEQGKKKLDLLYRGLPPTVKIRMWRHIEESGVTIQNTPNKELLLKVLRGEGNIHTITQIEDGQNSQCNCACTIEGTLAQGTVSISQLITLGFDALVEYYAGKPDETVADIFVACLQQLKSEANLEASPNVFDAQMLSAIVTE